MNHLTITIERRWSPTVSVCLFWAMDVAFVGDKRMPKASLLLSDLIPGKRGRNTPGGGKPRLFFAPSLCRKPNCPSKSLRGGAGTGRPVPSHLEDEEYVTPPGERVQVSSASCPIPTLNCLFPCKKKDLKRKKETFKSASRPGEKLGNKRRKRET